MTCKRCGGVRNIGWWNKTVLSWKISRMRKIGYGDTAIINHLDSLITALCNTM